MPEKTKPQLHPPRWLSRVERMLYWGSWLILALTFGMAIHKFNEYLLVRGQISSYSLWNAVTHSGLAIVFGMILFSITFVVNRLLHWGLRLQAAITAKDETIHELIQEQHELEIALRLTELNVGQDQIPDPIYEEDEIWQTK